MTTSRRSRLARFPIAIVALLVASCSGGATPPGAEPAADPIADPVALIRSISKQVDDIGTFRMTFAMSVEAAGQTITATGDGEFSEDPVEMHATYRFEELPGLPRGSEMEMILDGSIFYLRMPAFAGTAGIVTEWVSMDINDVAPGFDGLVDLSQGQNDPTSSLAYLRGITDAHEVGTETVAGVDTVHYRGSIDPKRALDRLGEADDSARSAVKAAEELLGANPMPVDVWVDGDGLLRRMTFEIEADGGTAQGFAMEMTMEIPEYGIVVDLPVPSGDQVTDLTHLIPSGDY